MKLKKLIKDLPVKIFKGNKDINITGISENSKRVSPGNLFIARKGSSVDGSIYIQEAVDNGAVAVLSDSYNPFLDVVQLIHSDVRNLEGQIAANYYQEPSKELFVIGITGTNGKTTTSYLVKHLLDHLGVPCGLIGTIECIVGDIKYQSSLTTNDVITNHKLLREMLNHNCEAAVMEVSSHALEQGRVSNIDFDVAIFTNLTQDHLDYHKDMASYGNAKAKLFHNLANHKTAIVNADSSWHDKMLESCAANVITYGINNAADVQAKTIEFSQNGTSFEVSFADKNVLFQWPLIGRFNIYNCLAAISVCLSRGTDLEELPPIISTFKSASGRLERVLNQKGLNIFVDYAHTDDALENVLTCLQEIKKGKIITVFGCGGNRDKGKRSKMASVAEKFSDFIIVTTDNPRNEDPVLICKEIVQGFSKSNYVVDLDRRSAIAKAINLATSDDLILIAGKGHETYQIFSHKTIEFDDRKIAAELAS